MDVIAKRVKNTYKNYCAHVQAFCTRYQQRNPVYLLLLHRICVMQLLHFIYLLECATLAYANNALNVNTNTQNGKHVDEAITRLGSDWYYAICAIMGATAIGILCTSYLKPRSDRIFFYMCAAICTTACIAYYAMGSNLGWTPIDNEWRRQISGVDGRNREIFYVRYIDW